MVDDESRPENEKRRSDRDDVPEFDPFPDLNPYDVPNGDTIARSTS
jgi:hypothetical protein